MRGRTIAITAAVAAIAIAAVAAATAWSLLNSLLDDDRTDPTK